MTFIQIKQIEAAIGRVLSKHQNRALLLNEGTLLIPLSYAKPFLDKLAYKLKQEIAWIYDDFILCNVSREYEAECIGGSLLKVINDLCKESYGEPLVMHFVGGSFSDANKALAGKDADALRALYLFSSGIAHGLIYKPIWDLAAKEKMLWLDEKKTCLLMSNAAFSRIDPFVVKKCFSPFILNGYFVKVLFFADAVQGINLYGKSTRAELDPDKVKVLTEMLAGNEDALSLLKNIYESAMFREWSAKDFIEVDRHQPMPYQELKAVHYHIGQRWGSNDWYAVRYTDLAGIVKNIKQFADEFSDIRISNNGKMLYLNDRAFKYLHKLYTTQSWKYSGNVIIDMKSVKSSKICSYDTLEACLNNKQTAA